MVMRPGTLVLCIRYVLLHSVDDGDHTLDQAADRLYLANYEGIIGIAAIMPCKRASCCFRPAL